MQRLGRADAVEDDRAGPLLPAPEDVGGQRLAGRDAPADRRQVGLCLVERGELGGVEGRHAEIQRRLVFLDHLEGHVRRRPRRGQDRGAADPQREGHGVAEAVGEEQLGGREADVVLADAQRVDAVELAGHHHVALAVDRALGKAGRSRGIEPEGVVLGGTGMGLERRIDAAEPLQQVVGQQHVRRLVRRRGDRGLDLAGVFGRVDHRRGLRILDHVLVVLGAQQGVERHRHGPRLDRTPEQVEEFRAVLDDHQHAGVGRHAHRLQHVAAAADRIGERRVADLLAVQGLDRRLVPATFRDMAVDERNRHIEPVREPQARRFAPAYDLDSMILHDLPLAVPPEDVALRMTRPYFCRDRLPQMEKGAVPNPNPSHGGN